MKSILDYSSILAATFPALALAQDPTFTFGAASNYEQAPAETASPSSGELRIVPRDLSDGIPSEGIDFFLGSDLQSALDDVLTGVCADGLSDECNSALSGVLDTNYAYTLETRQIGIAVAASGAAIAAFMAYLMNQDQPTPIPISAIHIPQSDVSQIQSQTASSVIAVTATDASPITLSVSPTPTMEDTPAAVSTLTNGDVQITLPTQPADLLQQLLRKDGAPASCQSTESRKRQSGGGIPNYGAIDNTALFILPMAAPGQLLNAFGLAAGAALPALQDAVDQASLQAAQTAAAAMDQFANVASDLVDTVAEIVWIAVYDFCVNNYDDLTELVLEDSLIDDNPAEDDDDDDDNSCASDKKDAPRCDDTDCAGDQGYCTSGDQEGCECLEVAYAHTLPGNKADWEVQQQILGGNLSESDDLPGEIECNGDTRINLEAEAYTSLVTAFCEGADLSSDISKEVSPAEDTGNYEGYTFSFEWKSSGKDCSASCEDIYKAFTGPTVCKYDSHVFTTSGTQELSCGTASFNFTESDSGDSGSDDSGDLSCGTETDMGNPNHFMDLDTVNSAADYLCQALVDRTQYYDQPTTDVEINYNSNWFDPIYFSLSADTSSGSCTGIDFTQDGTKETCQERLGTIINSCDTSNPDSLFFWKQGGSLTQDCMTWTLRRDSFIGEEVPDDDSWRPVGKCENDDDCNDYCDTPELGLCSGPEARPYTPGSWCGCLQSG